MSLDKVMTLLWEAETDIKAGCYNKAVSASYFSLRMAVELYFQSRRLIYSTKDDKMARLLINIGLEDVGRDLFRKYVLRKEADHRSKLFTEEEALKVFEDCRKHVLKLLKLIEGES